MYVLFGHPLIVPAARLFPDGQRVSEGQLDDGRKVPIVFHRIAPRPIATGDQPATAAALRWLGAAQSWEELAPGAPLDPGAAEWCELKLPVDSYGHWLWLGKRHVDLAWLPASKIAPLTPAVTPPAKGDDFYFECLRIRALDPLCRWQAELAGYKPAAVRPTPMPVPFADPTEPLVQKSDDASFLDRIAKQRSEMWSLALSALNDADRTLSKQTTTALAGAIRMESEAAGRTVPVWPDVAESERLLQSLLSERENPRRLTAAARDWLMRRPQATAWTSDDGGLWDADQKLPLPRVGVANFTSARAVAWARGEAEGQTPELMTLDPWQARVLTLPALVRPAPTDGSAERPGIEVRVGSWSAVLATQRRQIDAVPPGVPIAPAFLDHTMTTWALAQNVSPLPAGGRSVLGALTGMLLRESGSAAMGSGWSLYFEVEKSAFEHQTLRIWFGPTGRSLEVIVVDLPESARIPESAEGSAIVRAPGARDEVLRGAQIRQSKDRWTVRIPVPNRAIERPGLLRIGVEHARGAVRSAWPRAMFPWATEPGRALINVSKW